MKTWFLLISIIMIAIYIIMLILKKTNVLGIITHKRILNIALLISFIAVFYSAISSILWRDFGILLPYIFSHIFWGIIMIWLSIFHACERKWFFTGMLKLKKKETSEIK